MEDYSRIILGRRSRLEGMLGHQFGVPVRIEQFQGQWLNLQERDRSMLPGGREPDGRHNRQGRDVVLGKRVWNVESKFRIRLGPLGLDDFYQFLPPPIGECLIDLTELTRTYVGTEFDFDVQLVLAPGEWPRCELGGAGQADGVSRLECVAELGSVRLARTAMPCSLIERRGDRDRNSVPMARWSVHRCRRDKSSVQRGDRLRWVHI